MQGLSWYAFERTMESDHPHYKETSMINRKLTRLSAVLATTLLLAV